MSVRGVRLGQIVVRGVGGLLAPVHVAHLHVVATRLRADGGGGVARHRDDHAHLHVRANALREDGGVVVDVVEESGHVHLEVEHGALRDIFRHFYNGVVVLVVHGERLEVGVGDSVGVEVETHKVVGGYGVHGCKDGAVHPIPVERTVVGDLGDTHFGCARLCGIQGLLDNGAVFEPHVHHHAREVDRGRAHRFACGVDDLRQGDVLQIDHVVRFRHGAGEEKLSVGGVLRHEGLYFGVGHFRTIGCVAEDVVVDALVHPRIEMAFERDRAVFDCHLGRRSGRFR